MAWFTCSLFIFILAHGQVAYGASPPGYSYPPPPPVYGGSSTTSTLSSTKSRSTSIVSSSLSGYHSSSFTSKKSSISTSTKSKVSSVTASSSSVHLTSSTSLSFKETTSTKGTISTKATASTHSGSSNTASSDFRSDSSSTTLPKTATTGTANPRSSNVVQTLTEPDGSTTVLTLPSSLSGIETVTTNGQTLTAGPLPTGIVETFTEPNGSTIVLTLPLGSSEITALETIVTDGFTLTIGPAPIGEVETLTEPDGSTTILTLPSGSSITRLTTIVTDGHTLTVGPAPTGVVETLTEPDDSTVILTLPSSSTITGLETIVTDGSTLTVGPTPTGKIETLTEPDGSTIVLTLPSGSSAITGLETVVTDGSTITVAPLRTTSNGTVISLPTGSVETLTEPDGSTIVLTIPSDSSAITGLETISTDSSTLTVGPPITLTSGSVTSTMTTLPPGVSIEAFTDSSITTDIWLTTTGSDSSTTIVPVVLPCVTCEPEIVWDTPEIPFVEFDWPQLPKLPPFHLPCIKIFGIRIAGTCPSPSGPPPVNDGDPPDPQGSEPPDDDPEDDPCELDTNVGLCDNGNYPVFDPTSGTVSCDYTSEEATSQVSQCQKNIDKNLASVESYIENERSCCPASSKARRDMSNGMFSRLTRGLGLEKRVDYCYQQGEDPRRPPAGQCYATYTCDHNQFPNVCGNAKSAITNRGKTSILTHVAGSDKHDTKPWYQGHYFSSAGDVPLDGWKLKGCEVEEYPFGSGDPNRAEDGTSVLRLVPGGGGENQAAGKHLGHWVKGIADQYNEGFKAANGKYPSPRIKANGIIYCVDFDPAFTNYLPEQQVNDNVCASEYGAAYGLVNDYIVNGVRTWDPWFDAPGTVRKTNVLMHYIDQNGNVYQNPTPGAVAVYADLPPTYCKYPSPGRKVYDFNTDAWVLDASAAAQPRNDLITTDLRCANPPGTGSRFKREESAPVNLASTNQTRYHPRDISKRQASSGTFLDPDVYIYLGCLDNDDSNGEGIDPCADNSNPCANPATAVPTTNNANPTLDPLPSTYSTSIVASGANSSSTAFVTTTSPATSSTASVSPTISTTSSAAPLSTSTTSSAAATSTSTAASSTSSATSSANASGIASIIVSIIGDSTITSIPTSTSSSVDASDIASIIVSILQTTSYVSCSTQNPDPDGGISEGYCVCSGSTFTQSTNAAVTPINVCAYTTPLPAATTSIATLPTTPTTTVTTAPTSTTSPYVFDIYNEYYVYADAGASEFIWYWNGISLDADNAADANVCNEKLLITSLATTDPVTLPPIPLPTSLGTFSLTGHSACSYQGPNTASAGSVVCDDGLTASCTIAPPASATSSINCLPTNPFDDPIGEANDDWYFAASCEYS